MHDKPHPETVTYHRHCFRCGWGFTLRAWQKADHCPRCGKNVKPRRRGYQGSSHSGRRRAIYALRHMPSRSQIVSCTRDVSLWMQAHPLATAALLGAGGATMILSGAALAGAGAALAALGSTIVTGTTVAGFVMMALGSMQRVFGLMQAGALISLGGVIIGGIITLIGSIIAAAGALLTAAGWIAVAACLLILVSKAGRYLYEHREEIARLIQAVRDRQHTSKSLSGSPVGLTLPSDGREITLEEILNAAEGSLVTVPSAHPERHG